MMEKENPEKKARKVGSIGELAEDFSWKLLCMLAEADVKGRIAEDIEEELALVSLAWMIAEEAGCLCSPCHFADSHTRRAYDSQEKQERFAPASFLTKTVFQGDRVMNSVQNTQINEDSVLLR